MNYQMTNNIMLRVKAVYWLRRLTAPLFIKPVVGGAFLGALWLKVSLINVLQNAVSVNEPVSFYNFVVAAFRDAELVVKILALGAGAFAILLAIDITRNVAQMSWVRAPFLRFR